MNNTITLDNTTIKTDSAGRYCLNDLHKAAGGEPNHQPAFFLRREETAELMVELSNSADSQSYQPVISNAGRYGGTYVCMELAYAYTMWLAEVGQAVTPPSPCPKCCHVVCTGWCPTVGHLGVTPDPHQDVVRGTLGRCRSLR
ncbi:hypothetical protein GCM10027019_31070 [Melaminivora jejuensis]|uniref:KilA-N domain-containing protein n=1 Tax=Melaminivora jejuensis TaxID=1267217 RepID=UPI001AE06191|nr:KilA-N domain-containing protein [Melaminivora jejuensis]UHJ66498.1 KilA-N domain-containing protein [Melaminivora jejuensis]